jgi:DNA-binding beta-propeller fold protein YncE
MKYLFKSFAGSWSCPGRFYRLCIGLVIALALSGCAKQKEVYHGKTFWPDVDLPRLELLKFVNDNLQVIDNKKSFSLVALGNATPPDWKPFIKLNAVQTHKGKVYVCDSAQAEIFILDFPNQTFEPLKGNFGRGKLRKPLGIAIGGDDKLYVSDVARHDVAVYDPEGNYLASLARRGNSNPSDVAVDDYFAYILDTKRHIVDAFDLQTGKLSHSFGQGQEDPDFNMYYPLGLGLDKDGFIYVSNMATGRISRFDRDGHGMQNIGGGMGTNPSFFSRPRDVEVDHEGNVYVVDAGHQNVQMFNKEGRLLMFFGDANSMSMPAGIAVSTDNLEYFQSLASPGFVLDRVIYVANHFDNRLSIFGFGKRKGIDYEAEYTEIMQVREEKRQEEEGKAKKTSESAQ